MLAQIIEKYMPYNYYSDMSGLIRDMGVLDVLLKKYLPKIAQKLMDINLEPMLFAVQWFVCIMSYNFPAQIVLRVWDIFFIEGLVFVFKLALSILHISKNIIMRIQDSNEGIGICGRLASNIEDIDLLLETASKFNISLEEINSLREGFNSKNPREDFHFDLLCPNDNECKRIQKVTSEYLTFRLHENINIIPSYFDSENTTKTTIIFPSDHTDKNLMTAVKNHLCRKEKEKKRLSEIFSNPHKSKTSGVLIMPRVSLSPFFMTSDLSEVSEN